MVYQSYTGRWEITQDNFGVDILRDFVEAGVLPFIKIMNTSRKSLVAVLRDWRVSPPPDPNFRHNVWQRLHPQIPASWPAYLRGHAVAWMLVTVLTVSGAALTGHAAAQIRVRADREKLAVTYLVDLDPRVQAVLKR